MKTKRLYSNLNNSQKIRLIINGIGIFTRIKDIPTMFATEPHRAAADHALTRLNTLVRINNGRIECEYSGFGTTFGGVDIQVTLL